MRYSSKNELDALQARIDAGEENVPGAETFGCEDVVEHPIEVITEYGTVYAMQDDAIFTSEQTGKKFVVNAQDKNNPGLWVKLA